MLSDLMSWFWLLYRTYCYYVAALCALFLIFAVGLLALEALVELFRPAAITAPVVPAGPRTS